MMKSLELSDPTSCLNKALPEEVVFVILARDPSATAAIKAWAEDRVRKGLNKEDDPQIVEAFDCAVAMIDSRASIRQQVVRQKASFSQKFTS